MKMTRGASHYRATGHKRRRARPSSPTGSRSGWKRLSKESHLSEKPPEVLGVAVILPPPREVVASVEGMENDPEVEAIAIRVVKEFEIAQGRKPVSVEE